MSKAITIQPLHGGNDGHIRTLEDIREHVDAEPALTKEELVSWYAMNVKHGKGTRKGTSLTNSELYMNSLFQCGLLVETRVDGPIKCTFPPGKARDRGEARDCRVVEIIDEHVLYILKMLRDARVGKTEMQLQQLGSRCGLGDRNLKNQIQKRRGWLQSAQLLVRRDGKLCATPRGLKLIRKHFPESVDENPNLAADDQTVQNTEFGGPGEGPNHKTLKEYIHKVAAKICKATVKGRQMEYPLNSGDKVDVTAWNARKIWHIEVKSHTSNDKDIERGIYQSIKYAAVGEAMEKVLNSSRRVESLLVVENKLSEKNKVLKGQLGVRVYRLPLPMRSELRELRRKARG